MTIRKERWNASLLIAYLTGFFLLFEQEKSINFPGSAEILPWIRVAEIILLGAVLFRVPYREHPWYILMILAVLVIFVTSAIRSASALNKAKTTLNHAVLVYLLCPAVGLLIAGDSRKRFLKILIAVWTAIHVAMSVVGFYAVYHGLRIMNYAQTYYIGLMDVDVKALVLWDHNCNSTSVVLTISIAVSLIGFAISEKRGIKAIYLLAAAVMFIAQTMTGGRSGELSSLIGFGVAAAALCQKPMCRKVRKKWLRILLSLLLVAAVAVGGLFLVQWTQAGINRVMQQRLSLLPVASAEAEQTSADRPAVEETPVAEPTALQPTPTPPSIRERSFLQAYFLTGRAEIWREALGAIQKKPSLLLTGTSVTTVMKDLKEITKLPPNLAHLHNEFLQVLLCTGIWGAMLFLLFVFFALRAAYRLFFDDERPLWERLIMLPFLCLFAIDQVEAVRLTSRPDLNALVFLFAGVGLALAFRQRKPDASGA